LVRKKSLVDWAGVGKKSLRLRVVDEEQDDQGKVIHKISILIPSDAHST